ncbi:MAG TPA: GAF domain-containing protein [Anaerolineae bacterium]|nr:GAF domain-containing protein [Anaerolineae bacterium]
METRNPARERFRRLKWLLVGIAALSIAGIDAFHWQVFRESPKRLLADWLIGMVFAITLIHISFAIINRVYDQVARQRERLAELAAASRQITARLDIASALEGIVTQALATLEADRAAIFLLDRKTDRLSCAYSRGLSPEYVDEINRRYRETPGSRLLHSLEPVHVLDAHTDPATAALREAMIKEGFHTYAALPLVSKGEVMGALAVYRDDIRAFEPEVLALAQSFANQAAIAIENARLYEETQRRLDEVNLLFQTSMAITQTLDLQQVLQLVMDSAVQAIPAAQKGSLHLLDEERGELVMRAGSGFSQEVMEAATFKVGEGYTGWAFARGRPLIVDNVKTDPRTKPIDLPEVHEEKSALCVPLSIKDKAIGTITLDNITSYGAFDEDDLRLLSAFASHAAIAIENARLYEMERSSRQLADTLGEITQALSSTLSLKEVLNLILAELERIIAFDSGSIMLLEGEDMVISAVRGFEDPHKVLRTHLGLDRAPLNREVVESKRPLVLGAVHEDERWLKPMQDSGLAGELGRIRSWMGIPLLAKDKVIGMLTTDKAEADFYSAEDAQIALAFAGQAAIAIENARLYEQTKRRLNELSLLNEVALISASTLDFDEMLEGTVEALQRRLGLEVFGFLIVDEEAGELRLHPTYLGVPPELKDFRIPLGEGITGWVAQSGQPLLAPDVSKEPRYFPGIPEIRSEICVPLKVGQKVIGVIDAESTRLNAFSEDDLRLLSTLAGQLALSLENARLYERVRWSEERYRDLFENANDLIFTLDRDFNITDANKVGERLTGYTLEEARGMNVSHFLSPKDLERARLFLANLLAGRPVQQPFEVEIMRKDGGKVLCEITGRLIKKEGKPVGVHCIARDVTERRRLQEQLLQSEKLSAIGQMISGVAHELNNPLTTVMGFAQLLQAEELGDQVKQDLEKISQAAERARRIVRNLLIFARQHKPGKKYVDINEIIQRTLELRAYQLKVDNITVTLELDERLPRTMADPYQMQQVFLNLINNAHQAMVADRGRGHLTVRSQMAGDTIQVTIMDDGPGIPEKDMRRIFDPFFTTKEVGEGTGLGLAICYGIVQKHGGRIWAESEVGRGTTFTVELPVKEMDLGAVSISPEGLEPSTATGKTVLVVEDEEAIAALLTRILEAEGHQVDTASDGRAAVKMLERRDYDLIISDLKMAGMNGQKLYSHLQKTHPPLARRVLFITGDVVSADTRAFLERVSNPYLSKPFPMDAVVAAVQEVLTGDGESS